MYGLLGGLEVWHYTGCRLAARHGPTVVEQIHPFSIQVPQPCSKSKAIIPAQKGSVIHFHSLLFICDSHISSVPVEMSEPARPTLPSHTSPLCLGLNGPAQGPSLRSGAVISRVSSAGGVSGGVAVGSSMVLDRVPDHPLPPRRSRTFSGHWSRFIIVYNYGVVALRAGLGRAQS